MGNPDQPGTKANLFVLVGQKYHACSHRGSKSQALTMSVAKKNRKLGSLAWTSPGWNPAPDPPGLHSPSKGVSSGSQLLAPLLVLERGRPPRHDARQGYFLCFPFLHLYLCLCIQFSLYTADIAEGKSFTQRHWFESTEYGQSRHLWLLDGISRLWESMFHCGVPEKGKMGRWMVGSWLNYAWRPDGHVRKAAGTGSDALLQVRIGRSSQQAGTSLDCPII